MMSISKCGTAGDSSRYYINMESDRGREDYYASEGAGRWSGAGAAELGLTGQVSAEDFRRIAEGRNRVGADLVRGAGESHRVGWDCTFSAPKSVSVAWALAEPEARAAIEAAHQAAVEAGLSHLQEHAVVARRGHAGTEQERAEMVVASFDHATSREQDPQLHTHNVIFNLARRLDGSWGGIESRLMHIHQHAAGAVYRAELASQMQELGYSIERDKSSFRLAGTPTKIEKEFSTRRQQIQASLDAHGASSAKASEVAALATRRSKETLEKDQLHESWQQRAAEAAPGWDPEQLKAARVQREPMPQHAQLMRAATESASTLSEAQLMSRVFQEAQGRLSAADAREYFQVLTRDPECIKLRTPGGAIRYTSKEMLAIEQGLSDTARARQSEPQHQVSERAIEHAIASRTLSEEQQAMIRHVTADQGVTCVQGMAGTGKSYSLGAARDAWESSGYRVTGAALAGKAAAGLEEGAGIKSQTLHSLISELDKSERTLTPRDVIVLDEAGMVGSRQMHQIMQHTSAAGAKLVLVGDSRQLQPIDAGGAFRAVQKEIGAAELREIRRQSSEADRQAVHALADGRAGDALTHFKEAGRLHTDESHTDTMRSMVNRWSTERDPSRPGESIMLAGTRNDVRELNQLAREQMKSEHRLGPSADIRGAEYSENDRIIVTQNHRESGLKNGMLATLDRLDLDRNGNWHATLTTDDGQRLTTRLAADTEDYRGLSIDHGYAMSCHKSQGVTVDRAYVLVSETMSDREWSYVAGSRARHETHIYADRDLADDLERSMCKSRQADASTDYQIEPQPQQPAQAQSAQIEEAEVEL